jgi:hypothetical protein
VDHKADEAESGDTGRIIEEINSPKNNGEKTT